MPEKAVKFYSAIFGWTFMKDEELPIPYWRVKTEGINGGLLQSSASASQEGMGTNAYVCSMEVEHFDAIAAKILEHGGKVALEKFAVPGKCWQGYFIDLDGNTFGLVEIDEDAA